MTIECSFQIFKEIILNDNGAVALKECIIVQGNQVYARFLNARDRQFYIEYLGETDGDQRKDRKHFSKAHARA